MNRPLPTREESLALLQRLLDGDPTATCDLCARYLPHLLLDLKSRFPFGDPHLLLTAAHESLLNFLKQPSGYQCDQSDLGTFLRLAARRDFLNLQRRENRHFRSRVAPTVVEIDPPEGNSSLNEEPLLRLVRHEETLTMQRVVQQIRQDCTAGEQKVLDLLLDGVHDTGTYVAALQIAGLPETEQLRQIKQLKDRLKKRLQRGWRRHG